jgi:hypothetical protein
MHALSSSSLDVRKSAHFGVNGVFRSGAPRSTKMGNIASPWRYEAVFDIALLPADAHLTGRSRYDDGGRPIDLRRLSAMADPAGYQCRPESTLGMVYT